MSFSQRVKEETAKIIPETRHCALAELSAVFTSSGFFWPVDGRTVIGIRTENVLVAKTGFSLIKKLFGTAARVSVKERNQGHRGHLYTITLEDSQAAERMIRALKLEEAVARMDLMVRSSDRNLLKSECCRKAFLRGVFLASGSLSDPEKIYHLELVSDTPEFAEEIRWVMSTFGLNAKTVERKGRSVVYLKEGNEKNTPKRTAERPRGDARSADGKDRPAIKDGLEPRSKEDRPVNGQRSTGNRPQGVRPGNGQPQQGVRPGNGQPQQGQRPGNGQPQQGQRPMNGQPQQGARPANGQPQQGQRPANGQPQQGVRPGNGQPQQGQRPMNGQPQQGVRPAPEQAQGRPVNPQPQQGAPRPKNFAQDGDDMEFEFLNWDSDE